MSVHEMKPGGGGVPPKLQPKVLRVKRPAGAVDPQYRHVMTQAVEFDGEKTGLYLSQHDCTWLLQTIAELEQGRLSEGAARGLSSIAMMIGVDVLKVAPRPGAGPAAAPEEKLVVAEPEPEPLKCRLCGSVEHGSWDCPTKAEVLGGADGKA